MVCPTNLKLLKALALGLHRVVDRRTRDSRQDLCARADDDRLRHQARDVAVVEARHPGRADPAQAQRETGVGIVREV